MRIRRIKLKNIRSHKETEITLEDNVTTFTGATGSGKSSIMMAIEYALFGSSAIPRNSAFLKRDSRKGKVELGFEHRDNRYKVVRGLKKSGENITIDKSNMKIEKNGKEMSDIMSRAKDLDKRIREILGYPESIDAISLFETTSYTKQDEIRALIEKTPEKRQEYIDKILQLSKYKLTYNNMRKVTSHFTEEYKELEGELKKMDKVKEKISDLKDKISKNKESKESKEEKLSSLKEDYKKIKKSRKKIEKEQEKLLKKRRKLDKVEGSIEQLEKKNKFLEKKNKEISKEIENLKEERDNYEEVEDIDKYRDKKNNLSQKKLFEKRKLSDKKEKLKKLKEAGEGKCPFCGQEISKEHISKFEEEFEKEEGKVKKKVEKFEEEIKKVEKKIKEGKKYKELKEKLSKKEDKLKENREELKSNREKVKEKEKKLKEIKKKIKKIDDVSEKLKEKRKREKKLSNSISGIEQEVKDLKKSIREKKKEKKEKEKEFEEMKQNEKYLKELKDLREKLNEMREDIRSIRKVVRENFLEDFRQEFQKKFEDIRRYEEEYSVDVKKDYEPVAYSSEGREVSIEELSGGEKTSVALAYRLALSDLAAQISEIVPPKVLLLDEPTTGFDQEDIRSLPETLRGIETIPQIIIVSHEEELKNAADVNYKVEKVNGISKVEKLG